MLLAPPVGHPVTPKKDPYSTPRNEALGRGVVREADFTDVSEGEMNSDWKGEESKKASARRWHLS